MTQPEEILEYWLDDIGEAGWYEASDALDVDIRSRFAAAWDGATTGAYGLWLTYPAGALAYIILTDQFPRNMFRGTPKAFASDKNARAAARIAIGRDWDLSIAEPARQFFYMPLEHAEAILDQNRAVRLFADRMPSSKSNLLHACAHRSVIRQFGRFPFRNEVLGRETTAAEAAWLADGAYGGEVRRLQAKDAAQNSV